MLCKASSYLDEIMQRLEKIAYGRKYVEHNHGASCDGLLLYRWPRRPVITTLRIWFVNEEPRGVA